MPDITELREKSFYLRDAVIVAPDLIGKLLCRRTDGVTLKLRITETECYMGEKDLACHASRGKTPRNSVLYEEGGILYVYIVYGMHNLVNVITGKENDPQGVLIRCCEGYNGPAKLSKYLHIDRSLNRENILTSEAAWIEDDGCRPEIVTAPRVGIDYAGDYWKNIPWRFIMNKKP